MNDLLSQVRIRLNSAYIMNEIDSPIESVAWTDGGRVRINGYFNWSEHVIISSHKEMSEAINMIRSASWNRERHEYAKEFVRARYTTLMGASDQLLKVPQLETLYRDGLEAARMRVI